MTKLVSMNPFSALPDIMSKSYSVFSNLISGSNILLVTENADWIIRDLCELLKSELLTLGQSAHISTTSSGFRGATIHYGSINTIINKLGVRTKRKSARTIASWYHIDPSNYKPNLIPQMQNCLDAIHTSCESTRSQLIHSGMKEDFIHVIPIPIDLTLYKRQRSTEFAKEHLGIPKDRVVIGSFQKDGVGWSNGLSPKLIKGPDIFCSVVEKLREKLPVHVLLTGPARGYVKNRLLSSGIPFTHYYPEEKKEMIALYEALDLYLITSRIEGGPRALTESWAMEVPLVSTNVGMVSDYGKHGRNCLIADVDDVETLSRECLTLLDDVVLKNSCIKFGLEDVKRFEISRLIHAYANLYKLSL